MKFVGWLLWSACVLCSVAAMAATPAQGVLFITMPIKMVFSTLMKPVCRVFVCRMDVMWLLQTLRALYVAGW